MIIFPVAAQETIFHRFGNNLPDAFSEAAAFAMNGLLNFTREIGIADNMLIGGDSGIQFRSLHEHRMAGRVTKAHFDDDSVCLGVAGISL